MEVECKWLEEAGVYEGFLKPLNDFALFDGGRISSFRV